MNLFRALIFPSSLPNSLTRPHDFSLKGTKFILSEMLALRHICLALSSEWRKTP